MAGNEKVIPNGSFEHRATFQHTIPRRVFCSFFFSLPRVPTHLLQGDTEKETDKKTREDIL